MAFAAAGIVLAISAFLVGVRAVNGAGGPFESPVGTLAIWALFAAPGVLGLIGALRREPSLFLAAGGACLLLSVVAFSGITLPLIVPGLCFLLVAAEPDGRRIEPPGGRTVLVAVVAALVVLASLLTIGLIGALAVGVAGPIAVRILLDRRAVPTRRISAPRRNLGPAIRAFAAVGLVVSAAFALFGTTDTVCWTSRQTPAGIEYRQTAVPSSGGQLSLEAGAFGAGCDSGVLSVRGSILCLLLLGAATGAAAIGR